MRQDLQFSNKEISSAIDLALREKKCSVRRFSKELNEKYKTEIKRGDYKSFNKDFIQRVRTNDFLKVSERVIALCDALDIKWSESSAVLDPSKFTHEYQTKRFRKEFDLVESAVEKNPRLEKKVKVLLKNIADIASAQGA